MGFVEFYLTVEQKPKNLEKIKNKAKEIAVFAFFVYWPNLHISDISDISTRMTTQQSKPEQTS
jgi:hypothetical protein